MQKLLEWLKSDKIVRYGIAAILIAVPLYPKFPFIRIPGTYVSIRLEDILVFAVSLIWFLKNFSNMLDFLKERVGRSIIIFLLVCLIATVAGIFLTQTVVLHIGILHWARRVEYFICFFIGLTSIKRKEDLTFYLKCLVMVVIIVFIVGVGQKYWSWPVITTQNDEYSKGIALRYMPGGHLVSTFAGHYDLATFLILITPFLFTLFFSTKSLIYSLTGDKKTFITRGVFLLTIGVSFWLVANAASRISAISFVASIVVSLFLVRKKKFIPIVVVVSFIIFGLSTNLVNRYINIIDVIIRDAKNKIIYVVPKITAYAADGQVLPVRTEKLSSTPTPVPVFEDRSTSIRTNVEWPRAIRALMKNPILGTGFSSITLATDNDYLRVLGEVGILGFAAFCLVLFRIFKLLVEQLPLPKEIDLTSAFIAGIMGSLVGVVLNALFIDVFEASKFAIVFWLMIGFIVGVIRKKDEKIV